MDKFLDEYKAAFESVTAEKDITGAARSRLSKNVRTCSVKHIAAAACAVMLMGGTAVYAARIGWLDSLFGSSSKTISENSSGYAVTVSEHTLEYADENFPYSISFGDIICDGTILYGEMHITDKSGAAVLQDELPIEVDVIINGNDRASRQTGIVFLNENEDGSADAAFSVSTEAEIFAGDIVNVIITKYDFPAAEELGSAEYGFEILNMPQTLAKQIDVNSTARLTTYGGESTEMQINSIEISPLRISAKGHCMSYDSYEKITDSPDFRIELCDGSCLKIDKRLWVLDTELSSGESILNVGDRVCETFGFNGLLSAENDGYDVDFNAQFRCVLPLDEVVSVTIGDVTIPVE